MRSVLLTFLLGCLYQTSVLALQPSTQVRVSDLNSPWAVAWIDSEVVLITERPGRLLQIDLQTGTRQEVTGLPPIAAIGQGGLLDVAVDPQFSTNRWIYFSLTAGQLRQSVAVL